MTTETTKRFAILRKQLDKLNYTQPLTMESQSLVERLLSDLLRTSEGFQNMKKQFEEIKRASSQSTNLIEPLRRRMGKLETENNDLHSQIIKLKEEIDDKDIKWKTALNRLEGQKKDLKFILDQKEHKIDNLEKDKRNLKGKIDELVGQLYLPSEGVVLDGVPSEMEDEILGREHNQRRKKGVF